MKIIDHIGDRKRCVILYKHKAKLRTLRDIQGLQRVQKIRQHTWSATCRSSDCDARGRALHEYHPRFQPLSTLITYATTTRPRLPAIPAPKQTTATNTAIKPKKATKTTARKQRWQSPSTLPQYASRKQYLHTVADALGWTPSNNPGALCGGYFKEPKIVTQHRRVGNINKAPTTITARGPVTYAAKGVSILKKDVVVTQPGRVIKADQAYIYRDHKSGKISKVVLIGHVRMREAGKLIVAASSTLTLYPKTATLINAAYHIYSKTPYTSTIKGPFNAWGTAKYATREPSGIIRLQDATYTTCSPTDPAWQVSAKRIVLDKQKALARPMAR